MAATNVQAFSGDVEVASNLAVNTNDLFVDTVNSRVGIGKTNPLAPLDVSTGGTSGTQRTALKLTTPESEAGTGCNLDFIQDTANVGRVASVYEAAGKIGMAFSTWNSSLGERMRIRNDGKVGIGTNVPETYLHLSATNSDPGATEGDFVGTHTLTEYLRFTSIGDPGDVNNVSVGFKLGGDDSSGANPNGRLDICANQGSSGGNGFGDTPDKTIATFLGSGNVGIGTASPGTLLDIYKSDGGAAVYAQKIQTDNASTASPGALGPGIGFYQRWWSSGGVAVPMAAIHCIKTQIDGTDGGGLAFRTGAGNLETRMVIDHYGYVGLGTTDPAQGFHIYGNNQATLSTWNDGTYKGMILVKDSGGSPGNGGAIVFGASQAQYFCGIKASIIDGGGKSTGYMHFYSRAANSHSYMTANMTIRNDGNVGIGNTNPSYKLDVSGNIRMNNTLYGPGQSRLYFDPINEPKLYSSASTLFLFATNGYAYAALWVDGSDRRLKKNIKPLNNALDTIKKLNPVHYNKRYTESNVCDEECTVEKCYTEEDGFIAQEVQEIPELAHAVSHPESSDMLGLNYNSILTYCVKAVQEQQTIIEDEKAKVADLLARVTALENKETSTTETSNVTTETSNVTTETSNVTTETSNVTTETSNVA